MKKQHKISWLNIPGYIPETWNPIVGCTKISEGCEHCYAEGMAFRIANMELHNHGKNGYNYGNVVGVETGKWLGTTQFIDKALDKPLKWKQPRAIFVCSMGDLFHESASFEEINAVFSVMSDADQHIYMILTKRPARMAEFWNWKKQNCMGVTWCPKPNVWIGVTSENQQRAHERIPILLSIPASKHFVSIEPMLGDINLGVIHHADDHIDALNGQYNTYPDGFWKQSEIPKLDWVICGGETGTGARPMHPNWVFSLQKQCTEAGTPFFFKSWGKYYTKWADIISLAYPVAIMNPITGKCDILDGKEYHEFPTI